MSGSKSKQKGATGERELCNILTNVFGGSWIRVPHSGAFIGGTNSKRKLVMSEGQIKTLKGDIVPPDEWKHITIESKNYKEFPFHLLFSEDPIPVLDGPGGWIAQTKESMNDGDFWMLCFKITRKGWFVAFSKDFYQQFQLTTNLIRKDYIICDLHMFLRLNTKKIAEICQGLTTQEPSQFS